MLRPRSTYSHPDLASVPGSRPWLLLRRPLLLALVLGSTVSLITEEKLSLPLVLSASFTWSFVPLLQIASLAAVRPRGRGVASLAHTVDWFFLGQGPWLCWLVAFAAFWSSVSSLGHFVAPLWPWTATAAAAAVWSAYIDFWFFRGVLRCDANSALRHLLLQRALAWSLGILCFGASSLIPDLLRRFAL